MFTEGTVINDRYEIRRVVGTGGMAIVYCAYDTKTRQQVAIKVLRSEYASDQEFGRRFSREADAAAKMSHENIVNLLDVGTYEGQRYIVMEYIDGITLKDMIRRDGCIRADAAIRIIMRILAALDHAHKNGIVHRDVKPQNILVDKRGHVKVADFGIARLKTDSSTHSGDSSTSALGSVHYFSPEQAKGEVADEKSDLYSVGVVFYEMLTGKVPFDGETSVSIAVKHINEAPVSMLTINPSIPRALDEVVMRSLAKDPAQRYQSAAEMVSDIRKCIARPMGGFVKYPGGTDGKKDTDGKDTDARKEQNKARESKESGGSGKTVPTASEKKHRLYVTILISIALVMVAAIGFMAWYVYNIYGTYGMPDLQGMTETEAEQSLLEAGIKNYSFEYVFSDDVENGCVVRQEFEPEVRIRKGMQVHVDFSKGSEWYSLPDLTGQDISDVLEYLTLRDVDDVSIEYIFSELPENSIVSQMPAAGTVSRASAVLLYVSGHRVYVPSVYGMLLEDAVAMLESEGLGVGTITYAYSPDYEGGVVFAQSEAPKTLVLNGTPIDLTVCGKAGTYYPATDIVLDLTEDCHVTVIAVTPSHETIECFSEDLTEGRHIPDITSSELGRHILRIYIDDVLFKTCLVDFE